MIAAFQTYLQTNTGIPEEEVERICRHAIQRVLQRNEILLQEGSICRHKTFIVKGLLRTYGVSENGSEHILQFSPENTWTLDVESYDKQIPARFSIAAVEYSEILLWEKNDFMALVDSIPALRDFSQQLISRTIYNSRHRISLVLGATPEEKYDDFIRNHSDLLSRLPLHMIAGYLGISLKTLTRIRHAQLHR
ncbi:MAG: Crp/Fnr family transcriptional regulator [Ferruginibacter sp.]